MREIINHLAAQKTLKSDEAKKVLSDIASGKYNEIEMTTFVTTFLMRNITVEELSGFRNALLDHCLRVDLGDHQLIDLCGTGGDGKDTFNISTLSSFVVAGAGAKVAKHGNYSVSSSCGSSNILEHFGYNFTNNEAMLRRQIEGANICFLHAPLFNPAMKNIA
ncbi:MAG: anthranilate phosphoribosyltransferase, partial [Bacteroidales bacterium]|nr:anthranilate phosphoribosyltransferase [Bacteroidales bacterium]